MNIQKPIKGFWNGPEKRKIKINSRLRPMLFLLDAYLPEHYKNSTGSMRKVCVRFGVKMVQITLKKGCVFKLRLT